MATEWEAVKENAAPIERGRNPLKLSKTSDGMTERERKSNERTRSHFERLVRKSEESNAAVDGNDRDNCPEDDPLVHWLSYIKFVQDAYPADTQASFLLMERCTRALVGVDRYREDVRFLRVCILYADRTSSPSDVFKFLHQRKVGSRTSLFWVAWAWVAEKAGDYPFAEKVFKKALSKGAEPKKLLEDRHKQFQRRMSRHWLNASESNDANVANENRIDTGEGRGRLASLTTSGARYNQRSRSGNEIFRNDENGVPNTSRRSRRGGSRSTTNSISHSTVPTGVPSSTTRRRVNGNSNVASAGGAFSIYVDEDAEAQEGYNLDASLVSNSLHRDRVIASDGDRKKENEGTAEQWNARGGLPSAPDEDRATSFMSRRQRPGTAAATPAFEVFVDEDCAAKNEETKLDSQVEHAEQDGRSLRERLDGGLVDKLTKDPLRYVENPEKYAKDKRLHEQGGRHQRDLSRGSRGALSESVCRKSTFPASSLASQHGLQHMLGKDSDGQERCVEESRAIAKYYTLAPSTVNFSLLAVDEGASEMSVMEEIDESVDMEDATNSENIGINAQQQDMGPATIYRGQKSQTCEKSAGKATMPRRVLFAESKTVINSSTVSSQAGADVSCASSTINERDAVGGDVRAEEETINTKFARGELSLMFSSPAANASNGSILDASSAHQKSMSKPLFSVRTCKRKPLSESLHPNPCQNDEDADDDGDTATFSIVANLIDADCHEVDNSISEVEHSGAENTCADNGTLAAKPVVDNRNNCKSPQAAVRGFEIFCDDAEDENDREASQGVAAKKSGSEKKSVCARGGKRAPFTIHCDDPEPGDSNGNDRKCEDEGDTATFSVFGEAMDCLASSGQIQTTSDLPKATGDGRGECGALSIFEDDAIEANADNHAQHRKAQSFLQDGFTPHSRSTRQDVLTERFGDISRIVPDDADASHSRLMPSPAVSLLSDHRKERGDGGAEAVEYEMLHQDDICRALQETMDEASIQSGSGYKLEKHHVENRRTSSLPPSLKLKQKAPTRGSEITLTNTSFVIERELGRGVNGTVLLGRTKDRDDVALSGSNRRSCIAVKIQAPIGCLAWEYSLLTRLEKRIIPRCQLKRPRKREKTPHESDDVPCPFPKAISFVAYKDGGLLGMTAASHSGTNLVNVVNAHKRYGGRQVPELIAVYYTMKMLLHLEALHLQGCILHCDVKPDNWVLTESKSPCDSGGLIEGADLMLVDFGRAIDLLAIDKSDPLKVTFAGNAAAQDMACVAMREGRSWGIDLDTYGLCASSYVLLYGEHMEIVKDSSGRWRLSKPFRRYWKKELWNDVFDTLLNDDTEVAHGRKLRALRKSFESYLDEGSRKQELAAHLRQQAILLKSAG